MKLVAIVLSSSILVACGGGGGGGSTTPTPVVGGGGGSTTTTPVASTGGTSPATPTAVLNSSNQTVAAQDAASTAFMPMLGAQTLTGAQTTDESVLFSIARDQMDKLPAYMADAKANSALTGAVQSPTTACPSGGTLTVSVNDADNNGVLSAGDSMTLVSNSCVLSSGTVTGSLGFVIDNLSGTLGSSNYSAGITLTFGSFSVSSSLFSGSINGSLSLAATANGVNSLSETILTPSLTVAGTYGGVTRSRSLTNYRATASRVPTANSYQTSYSINATLTSTGISFATSTPFVRRATDNYPSSGVMVITGASNSKLRITALSNSLVMEELDANGDDIYESTSTVNWNTLM